MKFFIDYARGGMLLPEPCLIHMAGFPGFPGVYVPTPNETGLQSVAGELLLAGKKNERKLCRKSHQKSATTFCWSSVDLRWFFVYICTHCLVQVSKPRFHICDSAVPTTWPRTSSLAID